jgi:hypothetical protein
MFLGESRKMNGRKLTLRGFVIEELLRRSARQHGHPGVCGCIPKSETSR